MAEVKKKKEYFYEILVEYIADSKSVPLFHKLYSGLINEIKRIAASRSIKITQEQLEETCEEVLKTLVTVHQRWVTSPSYKVNNLGAIIKEGVLLSYKSDDEDKKRAVIKGNAYIRSFIFTTLKKYAPNSSKVFINFKERISKGLKKLRDSNDLFEISKNYWTASSSSFAEKYDELIISSELRSKIPLRLEYADKNENKRLMSKYLDESILMILNAEGTKTKAYSTLAITRCLYSFVASDSAETSLDLVIKDSEGSGSTLGCYIPDKTISDADASLETDVIKYEFLNNIRLADEKNYDQILYAGFIKLILGYKDFFKRLVETDPLIKKISESNCADTDNIQFFLNEIQSGNLKKEKISRSTAYNRFKVFQSCFESAIKGEPAQIIRGAIKKIANTLWEYYENNKTLSEVKP